MATVTFPSVNDYAQKRLRLVDAALAKIGGVPVQINDAFRTGTLMLEPERQTIVCSTATLTWLDGVETDGGNTWRRVGQVLHQEIEQSGAQMKARMVDVGARVGLKVVDRRKTTRPTNDRVDFVCQGISDLVAQMAPFCDGRALSGNQVHNFAKRYGELRDEMAKLRTAIADAEGRFELAQHQIVQLMDGQGE